METRTSGSVRGMKKLTCSQAERFIPTLPSGAGQFPLMAPRRSDHGRDHRPGTAEAAARWRCGPLMMWNGPLRQHQSAKVVVIANATRRDRSVKDLTTIGLDLVKRVFQAYGADAEGAPLFNRKLRRAEVLRFFEKLPPYLIGVEACAKGHESERVMGYVSLTAFNFSFPST